MISLRRSERTELDHFDKMDRQSHAKKFVLQTGERGHLQQFNDPNITYLSIECESGELCGYFILAFEPDTKSVEFRRIIIDSEKRALGQAAITKMEEYCKKELKAKRIWLDVFHDNRIGIHIYEKLGYTRFNQELLNGRKLYLYEKTI